MADRPGVPDDPDASVRWAPEQPATHRQPFLHDRLALLRAPTQLWCGPDGRVGDRPVDGLYHGDVRVLAGLRVLVASQSGEQVSGDCCTDRAVVGAVHRYLDGPGADPDVRSELTLTVHDDGCTLELELTSRRDAGVVEVSVELEPDDATMSAVKSGRRTARALPAVTLDAGTVGWRSVVTTVAVHAEGGQWEVRPGCAVARWAFDLSAGQTRRLCCAIHLGSPSQVVRPCRDATAGRSLPAGGPADARAWLGAALSDLDALRVRGSWAPDDEFLAAGAPWFLTLFGRDCLWSARLLLPDALGLAGGTLRSLARLQGTTHDVVRAEQPGKIPHEIRDQALGDPVGDLHLPPLYYGTIDATPLWICLLHEAWRAGLPEQDLKGLTPHLLAALAWMRDDGDRDGDGLLEYIDDSGRGLANQGWKDSGDSIAWRDGRPAQGPLALCEVQGYAFQAAVAGAELLERVGEDGSPWRTWAARLAEAFAARFWVRDEVGPYVAIALDHRKRPVDVVSSNMGHLLGTGLLDPEQARVVAARLVAPDMASGWGLRTVSTTSGQFWPLSYHGGSVWPHDTAIAVRGLLAEGLLDEARILARGLVDAAAAFDWRMPELYGGDQRVPHRGPTPYPAACRPQAWSAAAAVVAHRALTVGR